MFIWHTVMPCCVFIVAYLRIFSVIRHQLKVSHTAVSAPSAGPSTSGQVENRGGGHNATVDGQSGPQRLGQWLATAVLTGLSIEQLYVAAAGNRGNSCDNLDQQVIIRRRFLALSLTSSSQLSWWLRCRLSVGCRRKSTSFSDRWRFVSPMLFSWTRTKNENENDWPFVMRITITKWYGSGYGNSDKTLLGNFFGHTAEL